MGLCGQHHAWAAVYPGKNPGADWIYRWVGLRAGLDFLKHRRVSLPADIRTPDRPTRRRNLTSTNGRGGGGQINDGCEKLSR